MKSFPFYFQSTRSDCGPTCLKMVAEFHGKSFNVRDMKNWSKILNDGSSMLNIMDAAKSLGLTCTGLNIEVDQLEYIDLPVILHWDKQHFVALFKIKNGIYYVADPSTGIIMLNKPNLLKHWQNEEDDHHHSGILLKLSIIN